MGDMHDRKLSLVGMYYILAVCECGLKDRQPAHSAEVQSAQIMYPQHFEYERRYHHILLILYARLNTE